MSFFNGRKTRSVVFLVFCLTVAVWASSPAAAQKENARAAPASASLFVPKVTTEGVVLLPIADENAPSKFSAAFAFKGDCWNKTPDKASASAPGALSVSGPALIASGNGRGEVVLEFKVTPEMKTLQFYLLGNGDRNMVSAALYLNGVEWCMRGVESPKTPIAINWKIEGNAGKTARLVLSKHTTSDSYYLIAAATPEALKGKDKPVEVKPTVAKYHLETKYIRTVRTTLTECVKSAAHVKNGDLIKIYTPIQPNLPTQQLKEVSLESSDYPHIKAVRTKDIKNPVQEFLCLTIPASPRTAEKGVTFVTTYLVDIYSSRLMRGPGKKEVNNSNQRSDYSVPYVVEGVLADYKNPTFQAWLKENGLIKPPEQTNTDFAYSVYQFLAKNFIDDLTPHSPRKASSICSVLRGACGDTGVLAQSICEANAVPFMMLVGRWAGDKQGPQFHVNSAIYDPDVGLVFLNPEGAPLWKKDKNPDFWFGWCDNFIAFHTADLCPEKGAACPFAQGSVAICNGFVSHNPFPTGVPTVYYARCDWEVETLR